MLDWYIDVIIGYLIRTVVRFSKIRRSKAWPIEKAVISSVICPKFAFGGPYAELGYTYTHNGQYYAGVHRKPFMWRSSAEDYAAQCQVGEEIQCASTRVSPKRRLLQSMTEVPPDKSPMAPQDLLINVWVRSMSEIVCLLQSSFANRRLRDILGS